MVAWLKNEFWNGYTMFEKIFLVAMVALQAIVYCFVPDSLIGMVCGIGIAGSLGFHDSQMAVSFLVVHCFVLLKSVFIPRINLTFCGLRNQYR